MSLGLTSPESWSATRVDSAEDGTHEDCSLFLTSASLVPSEAITPVSRMTATRTTHLVTGPVSFPAIWRCMGSLHQKAGTVGIGDFPERLRGRLDNPVELIDTSGNRVVTPPRVVWTSTAGIVRPRWLGCEGVLPL